MDSQDGTSVRSMRLKVLYTFDDASKTHCLARWPHLVDIQTAYLDEQTQIGVIELKTCIQAIVSASPELVAKLGQDYTVYAYDYSEYETPLVGQGMLSWVLASSSPTPNAPAHQSKTMVTGRVCRNVLGLFSKGAQETLEVKLRLVPVPTVMQSEYIESMQRYRELSSVIPHEFDAQTWTNFLRQNPGVLESKAQQADRTSSPLDQSGIEKVRQILSEGSTPRDFSTMAQTEPIQSASPSHSTVVPSRNSTPGGQRPSKQQSQPLRPQGAQDDVTRPSSSASMQEADFTSLPACPRRDSIQSGYASGDEPQDLQPRKRAKLYRTQNPGKSDLNIERQPSSLRVAASTAASVRIHRPTPVNPSIAAEQNSSVEPVRPPTPISNPIDVPRKPRARQSLLREQSNLSNTDYTSPYPMSDDNTPTDQNVNSPEDSRYQGLFEPPFNMPSSPPVLDCGFPAPSSPALPPMATDMDSGFMSGGVDDLLDDDFPSHLEEGARNGSNDGVREKRTVRPAVNTNSPASALLSQDNQTANPPVSDAPTEQQPTKEADPPLPQAPPSAAGSRPSSRCSARLAPKPLAPAPTSQSGIEQIMSAVPASDPVMPLGPRRSRSCAGPMSDSPAMATPGPQSSENSKPRSGGNRKKLKQIQSRLDQCIRDGQAPPYCKNCGAIETPTWRRAWSKEIEGGEELANEMANDPTSFYWESLEKDDEDRVTKFKIVKKSLLETDQDFAQVLLCNPCGLWLHKSKTMRPENRWNKAAYKKRKRGTKSKGPLNGGTQPTKPRSRVQSGKPTESSPVASDGSSPPEDGVTPRTESNENDEDAQDPPSKQRRANSEEPRKSSDTSESRWHVDDPMEALRRAIQSSPVRNLERRDVPASDKDLTPKPVRRALFPSSHGASKPLGETSGNTPRRTPRTASREASKQSQDKENQDGADEVDCLFVSPTFDSDLPTSPTPQRRSTRADVTAEKRLSVPPQSPSTARKEGPVMTPTKITAQKLQRIQGAATTPRQSKSPRQPQSNGSELPLLPGDGFNAESFEGMETMMADMFENDSSADFFSFDPSKYSSAPEWAGWFTPDAASAAGSDDHANGEQSSDDFINSILADPAMQKENMQFDPFALGDSNVLDSGFFGSESLSQDAMAVGRKKSNDSAGNEQGQTVNGNA